MYVSGGGGAYQMHFHSIRHGLLLSEQGKLVYIVVVQQPMPRVLEGKGNTYICINYILPVRTEAHLLVLLKYTCVKETTNMNS